MSELLRYPFSSEEVAQRIKTYSETPLQHFTEQTAYQFALHCIDLTTLEGSDTPGRIKQLCEKAMQYNTAAVCVYPPFVKQAKQILQGTSIKVAAVAGAFPSGQSPLEVKLAEVAYTVDQGADEIDMVISRGKLMDGLYAEVYHEIASIRNKCLDCDLKVILETGELQDLDMIYKASFLAIQGGADFIKTSTGKIPINATPESFLIMLDAISQHYKDTGKLVGIKPAGGIADGETAILFLKILENTLNNKWLDNTKFRIGASRLADKLIELI